MRYLLILGFLQLTNIGCWAQSLDGIWITKKIEFGENYSDCAHGRGILILEADSTFIFKRSGKGQVEGRMSNQRLISKDEKETFRIIELEDSLMILERNFGSRTELLTLNRIQNVNIGELSKPFNLVGEWIVDEGNSNFLEWETMRITEEIVCIKSSDVTLQTSYSTIENGSNLFLMLSFEYDGFMVHITELTGKHFKGYFYDMPPHKKVSYSNNEDCQIEPVRYKLAYELTE